MLQVGKGRRHLVWSLRSEILRIILSPMKTQLRCRLGQVDEMEYWRPLDQLPASRLLPPRSGLERSDFVPWHKAAVAGFAIFCPVSGRSGRSTLFWRDRRRRF